MLSELKKIEAVKVHHKTHITKVNGNRSAVEAVGSISLVVHALETKPLQNIKKKSSNRSSKIRRTVATKVMFIHLRTVSP